MAAKTALPDTVVTALHDKMPGLLFSGFTDLCEFTSCVFYHQSDTGFVVYVPESNVLGGVTTSNVGRVTIKTDGYLPLKTKKTFDLRCAGNYSKFDG